MRCFRLFVAMWLMLAAPLAQAQQREALAECLGSSFGNVAGFLQCQDDFLLTCLDVGADIFDTKAKQQCFEQKGAGLRRAAKANIAAEKSLDTDDLGAAPMRAATYRQRLAAAAFRRADRIGQAECDFQADTRPDNATSDSLEYLPVCYATAVANAYWNVVVHRRYFFPKIQSKLP